MKNLKFKRVTVLALCFTLLMSTFVFANESASDITIKLRGTQLTFDVNPYVNTSNRTMVEVRGISEALGAEISWDEATQTVIIIVDGTTVKLGIGKAAYTINNESKSMDTEAVIIDGRTMVPVRFVAEALNMNVDWDSSLRIVKITGAEDEDLTDGTVRPDNMGQQKFDIAAAAEELGVTEEELTAALGAMNQGKPDFAAAAETLGVTEANLIDALGITIFDTAAAAEELGVTEEELIEALGVPGQEKPDFATVAETLGVTEANLLDALGISQ